MYQPNRLLTNPINKYIVELAKSWEGYELLLRLARRFLFHNLYRPNAYVPEFNKPCFGVVCLRSDREKRKHTTPKHGLLNSGTYALGRYRLWNRNRRAGRSNSS